MVRFTRQRLSQVLLGDLPVLGGAAAALLAALFFVVLPDWRLEGAVSASGLPRLLSFAEPPLGLTARLSLALAGAVLAGAIAWSTLFLVWGPGGWLYRPHDEDRIVVRRADAHPDAPPRRPLSAAELGVPPPPAVRPVPKDLDQPLADYHPAAIPDEPLEPVRPVQPLVRAPEPEIAPKLATPWEPEITRIETFELTPLVRPAPRAPRPEETVEALLERLERVARTRSAA